MSHTTHRQSGRVVRVLSGFVCLLLATVGMLTGGLECIVGIYFSNAEMLIYSVVTLTLTGLLLFVMAYALSDFGRRARG